LIDVVVAVLRSERLDDKETQSYNKR
jgi:hypothetical protein